ncbi:MAG: four-helix bundle copper-binding protein [Planctomycetes bacterium]|nr:four-helix bundle copper-binding protein [Planctomycetota bacterium]
MSRILLALFAFGLAATLSSTSLAEEVKIPKDTCVKPCAECANECAACMKHCRDNKMEDVARECEICHHACLACTLAVGSKNPQAWQICETCEKVCNQCAATCDKGSNPQMKKCAEACRTCAKACADARK